MPDLEQLEGSTFRWPPVVDGVLRLTAVEFATRFDGIDWRLTRLVNGWPNSRIDELMPWHWATSEKG